MNNHKFKDKDEREEKVAVGWLDKIKYNLKLPN